jgi:heme O synthase-like polyprenyltransferase
MAVNIIGLGLLVAAIIFMIMGGLVGWIIGVICLIGGVGALFMSWQRTRRTTV